MLYNNTYFAPGFLRLFYIKVKKSKHKDETDFCYKGGLNRIAAPNSTQIIKSGKHKVKNPNGFFPKWCTKGFNYIALAVDPFSSPGYKWFGGCEGMGGC